MTEQEAYLRKLEAEKQQLSARIDELSAQADIERTDEALAELTGARQREQDFDRELAALRQADAQDFQRLKDGLERLRTRTDSFLRSAESRASALREGYRRKREAELRQLGAQFDAHTAALRRTRAEDALLTRREVEFFRQGFLTTSDLLQRLGSARGKGWAETRAEYERAWRELQESSRRIRADALAREAEPPSAHS
ncbi:hypothetical protein DRW03_14710 [Corallococcus sp. H22C18031201]|uniref:hypothetical protein n=1 Tax=Citreicoccus inhibens TaxID=2849499 RepID=UPI000E7096C8|nr:hypothetical protein [Citreicoccus inhibens]MBU8895404.1 hypothetical protein [Citreicoccus inhibens]RJS22560.1 hypothetical protein DRW03_14710 [Corallococcus sp. H22C18031201]